jgi:hypothetical protein
VPAAHQQWQAILQLYYLAAWPAVQVRGSMGLFIQNTPLPAERDQQDTHQDFFIILSQGHLI